MAQLVKRRKELVASLMKDGIYDAAVEVLIQHGIGGLTMDRVAEAAGVGKGSLYNYFNNKRELIRFIHQRTVEPAMTALEETLATPDPAPVKLEAVLRKWFEHFAKHRTIFDFMFNDPRTQEMLEPSKRSARTAGIASFTKLLEQGIAEGSFRPIDAARASEIFLGAVIITTEQQMILGEQRPVDDSVSKLMDVFLNGLLRRD
jgi:AcrR family transcriptional regulator